MRSLALHQLTAMDATPFELIDLAAGAGCDDICIFVYSPGPRYADYIPDPARKAEFLARQQDNAVGVTNLEVFGVEETTVAEQFRAALAYGAELGGKRAVVHVHDPEWARAVETFSRVCELAGEHGLDVGLEFTPFSRSCNSLDKAVRLLEAAAQPNAGVAIDCLHLIRTGSKPADLAGLAPGAFSYAQICDAPLARPQAEWLAEAVQNRLTPGEGELPLLDILRALPASLPLDVEVPLHVLRDQGVSARDRVRRAVAGAQHILGRL